MQLLRYLILMFQYRIILNKKTSLEIRFALRIPQNCCFFFYFSSVLYYGNDNSNNQSKSQKLYKGLKLNTIIFVKQDFN